MVVVDHIQKWDFAQKLLAAILSALGVLLCAFFIWVANTLIDIQGRVITIEATAKALSDARDRDTQNTTSRNARRLDRLEFEEHQEK